MSAAATASSTGTVNVKTTTPKANPKRAEIVAYARTLVGIHEVPDGSNDGPGVKGLQASTGAYRAPWCVSTRQAIDLHVLGSVYADKSANAYYYAGFAGRHGDVIEKPVAGCAVVYHLGSGHLGTVVTVHSDGTFDAVEGNEGNAVRLVPRDPRHGVVCTFVLRKELR